MPESGENAISPIPQLFPSPGHQFSQSPNHLFHRSQPLCACCKAALVSICGHISAAASRLSIICMAMPLDAWKAIWQCSSQGPGLSALKAMVTKPVGGSTTTSRRGGLVMLRLRKPRAVGKVALCSRMAKSWPWRWIWSDFSEFNERNYWHSYWMAFSNTAKYKVDLGEN